MVYPSRWAFFDLFPGFCAPLFNRRFMALGRESLAMVVDVTKKEQVEALYAKTWETFGRIDVSVQNAGVITIAKRNHGQRFLPWHHHNGHVEV